MPADDARVLRCLCAHLPNRDPVAPAPLSLAEWGRIATRLRQAGLSRPGALLRVDGDFWEAAALEPGVLARLQSLLAREGAWDIEMERLAGRGIGALTMADPAYPRRLRNRLRSQAPPVLFGAGAWDLLERRALAVVGSRDVDEDGGAFAEAVGVRCAAEGLAVVTGGAKGVDHIVMRAALESGGAGIGILAGDLERAAQRSDARQAMEDGRLLLLSPFHPRSGFTVVKAMGRNKLVYAVAEWGLVVASAHGRGGTWTGAREVLRHGWVPLFVRDGPSVPDGNRELLRPAAQPFPPLETLGEETLASWLARAISSAHESGGAAWDGEQDLFPTVWPLIAPYMSVPRTPDEVSLAFHLSPAQARAWLERAEGEGKARLSHGEPVRYATWPLSFAPVSQVSELRLRYQAGQVLESNTGRAAFPGWPEDEEMGIKRKGS
jgi:predicted Rossmann fold nucleotide-binding protein DprA/Smf involved in DNA uptake